MHPEEHERENLSALRVVAWIALAAAILVHLIEVVRYRIDSDEPQHLHVVWGWSHHLLQYRDVFDNHMPLFHLLMVPMFRLAGETPSVVDVMRWWMLPLFLAAVLLTWAIARATFGSGGAIAAAALLAAFPLSSLKGVEFRNDNLALPLVLLVALLSIPRPMSRRRSFLIGILLGLVLAVSAKLLIVVLTWILVEVFLGFSSHEEGSRRTLAWRVGAAVTGLAIPPFLIVGCFARAGAFSALFQCVVSFNVGYGISPIRRIAGLLLFLGFLVVAVRQLHHNRERTRTLYIHLFSATFAISLLTLWPIITPRDLLPLFPLLAVIVAGHLITGRWSTTILVVMIGCELAMSVPIGKLTLVRQSDPAEERIADALRLTRPGEYLMDMKGETVFRRRPYRFLLEHVGRALIAQGLIRDTIVPDMLRDGCFAATANSPLWPPSARVFLDSHMVQVGILRVWGAHPAPDGSFEIAAAGHYSLVSPSGSLQPGTIDGRSCNGVVNLKRGRHRYTEAMVHPVTVTWSVAYDRGFRPHG